MRPSNALIAAAPEKAATWTEHLQSRILSNWRPGEFDAESLIYAPDWRKSDVVLTACSRIDCGVLFESGLLCPTCRMQWRELRKAGLVTREEWIATPRIRHSVAVGCSVERCQRSHDSLGVCATHYTHYRGCLAQSDDDAYDVDKWIAVQKPQALPARQQCSFGGCQADRHNRDDLCGIHHRRFLAWADRQDATAVKTIEHWFRLVVEPLLDPIARTTLAQSAATPFGLLQDPLRWELLYAIQQRDIRGKARLTPIDLRVTYLSLRRDDRTSVVGDVMLGRASEGENDRNLLGFLKDLQWFIDDAYRDWTGVDERDPKVIFYRDLEIRRTSSVIGRDASLDLRAIQNPWIVIAVIAWARGAARGHGELHGIQTAWVLADATLRQRKTPVHALGRADMTAIVNDIRARWSDPSIQLRRIGDIAKVLRHAREDGAQALFWNDVPPQFTVDPERHVARGHKTSAANNPDEPFRFVPQPIIDWVMDHLEILVRVDPYRTAEARALIFIHERCGRRTGETVRLMDDCISYDSQGSPYLEWQQGKPPWGKGKRLPMHQETHDVIKDWQQIKRDAGIESKWLFPSQKMVKDHHYSAGYLGLRIAELLGMIAERAPFVGPVEGAEGNLIHFDLSTIDPYSFRHAFAQRLADATDSEGRPTTTPDVLQDYMGHKNFNTTMVYFTVTAKRRKKALSAIPPRRLNLLGNPVAIDQERDSFGKIAVTLGTCTEPQNVASNGHSCALSHACESCPFFLVDPLERDGMAAKRQHLKVQLERARIIRAASHMLDHYTARIADCTTIIDGIDTYIDGLEADERAVISAALEQMADVRRRATSPRRIDLRQILRVAQDA